MNLEPHHRMDSVAFPWRKLELESGKMAHLQPSSAHVLRENDFHSKMKFPGFMDVAQWHRVAYSSMRLLDPLLLTTMIDMRLITEIRQHNQT